LIADAAILELPKVSLQAKELLPEYSGIYYVLDEINKIWYIGKAKNIRKRWQGKAHHRIYQLEAQKKKHFTIYYEQVSESQLDSVEKQRIEKYHPHLNASPVKTKNVRPTETLLRETLVAIAPFAFILGVEPPRKEVKSQIGNPWLNLEKVLALNVIHICIDDAMLEAIYKPESVDEKTAIESKPFISSKAYASQWDVFNAGFIIMLRLLVNGYAIEVTSWSRWCPKEKHEGLREYSQTRLAKESIQALTPESLAKLQQQADREKSSTFYLQRLHPYTSDLIKLLFDEPVDREKIKRELEQLSEDYKSGQRGVGSRSQPVVDIDELLISRGIDLNKYTTEEVNHLSRSRIGLYIHPFILSNKQQFPIANFAYGILDNKEISTVSYQFDTLYLLVGVDKKAWLLIEDYLKDFARPATGLKNGEGYVKKFCVSARKYIVPAKVNIKLEDIGYSAWIPFGFSKEFPTFESATEEIRKRLIDSDLPGLKVTFKRETIEK
jgi:predicted GIY-YIG superfamily endonuclease